MRIRAEKIALYWEKEKISNKTLKNPRQKKESHLRKRTLKKIFGAIVFKFIRGLQEWHRVSANVRRSATPHGEAVKE